MWTILRTGLMVAGCVLVLGGLLLSLLVLAMFSSPGGIGAEKLLGPVFGFFALAMFFSGGVCFHLGFRMKAAISGR